METMDSGMHAIELASQTLEELDMRTESLIKVPTFNSKLFAEAILQLADSSQDRKIIGEKGKKHVMKHFQINKNMARVIEKIDKLINN